MLKLHVILAVDRAGLVGEDGETHHGVFDVGFLRQAPNLTVLCPGSRKELQAMLRWAVEEQSGPVAIRYPRGGDKTYQDSAWYGDPQINGVCCHRNGEDITLITYGTMLDNAMAAAELLEKHGIHATVLRLLCVAPIPFDQILANLSVSHKVLVIEDSCSGSGIREAMAYELCRRLPDCVVAGADLGLRYIPHGSVEQLHLHCGLDPEAIAKYAMEVCQSEN